ncbi:methyltransferase [Lithospermum erythrorhizon]|uniref:Methyltransferase n=1 Tax=Lithospermum erythrorhizon TaxID=34254 RepID=A0AAV3QXP6_LITER
MTRPLHRGSGGGRFSGNAKDLWEDSQMKDKTEKEDFDRTRTAVDHANLSVRSPFRVVSTDNSSYKNNVYENGFGSDPLSPVSARSRYRFILLMLKLSLVVIVILALTGSLWWTLSITNSSRGQIFRGYRRLQEQLVLDLEEIGKLSTGPTKIKELEYCSPEYENFIPCYNETENLAVGFSNGEELDRHCIHGVRHNCLVPAPVNYKVPLRWPTGKDLIWLGNVKITAQEVLSSGSLTKRMMVEEEQISFRPGNFMYDGVEDYSHQIAEMIGLRNESNFIQAGVRTVLDIGCGYGSFGAHLFSSNLLTICIADYEASGSQVQLTTERGLPAMIGSFNSMQLPYPSLSFDMVHCRNNMDWDKKDGKLLIEVDRLLRPGGYFVWTSPVTQPSPRDKVNQKKWSSVQSFTQSLCWEMLSQQEETVVWKKTSKKDCYSTRKSGAPLCSKGQDVESPYYRPLQACIGGTQSRRWIPIKERTAWPSRANLNAKELSIHGLHAEDLSEDTINWKAAVNNYWSLLSPLIFSDHPKRPGDEDPSPPYNMLRNVLDMNAHFGGFNAALLEAGKSVWVMNVIPVNTPNRLPLILDRGFTGVLHDWCEPFPTYPRTYDMVHGQGLLSLQLPEQRRCETIDIFTEIDRLLRPEGWIILRDSAPLIESARALATRLKWDARVVELESDSDEKLLICQKPFTRRQAS